MHACFKVFFAENKYLKLVPMSIILIGETNEYMNNLLIIYTKTKLEMTLKDTI